MTCIMLIALSCSRKAIRTKSIVETVETNVEIPTAKQKVESFNSFYEKFHIDSVFQYQRLHFPLQGEKIDNDMKASWTKENWRFIPTKIRSIDTSQFEITIIETDSTVIEKLEFNDDTGFHFDTRYKLINGKWFLIECNDINLKNIQ